MFLVALLIAVVASAATPAPRPPAAAVSPAPCPSRGPAVSVSPAPPAASAPCRDLKRIGRVAVGRKANLVGTALSASTGTIGTAEIATRPLLRPAEVLEAIPGLVVSQHSGGGKANQYYLRGFQLDHGTDLAADFNGVPINLGSHAHGQGYSDINYLIPELVGSVEFKKGPYFADQGDFAVAGGYSLVYRNALAPIVQLTVGDFGYDRILAAGSIAAGAGTLLYGLELAHDNGSYVRADEYHRYNGALRYTRERGSDYLALTGIAYNGAFNSTDQIPQRAVDEGLISRFGYEDATDGGNTYRYALSAQAAHSDPNGTTVVNVYGARSHLDLFSDFTYGYDDANDYYNVTQNPVTCHAAYVSCKPNTGTLPRTTDYVSYCPANNTAAAGAAAHSVPLRPFTFSCGDQREQVDDRTYDGIDVTRHWVAPGSQTTFGAGFRTDNIPTVGLYLTNARERYPNGTLSADHIVTTGAYAFLESRLAFGTKLRITPGLRLDRYGYSVAAYLPANSGRAREAMVDPKLALAYAPSKHQEVYLDAGESFHSNDARGVVGDADPQTRTTFDSTGAHIAFNAPLTRATGYEAGYRLTTPQITSTLSVFRLLVANELIFDGDHGTTSVGGPTVRQGIELANVFTPAHSVTIDADLATTTARFLTDPTHVGTGLPESLAGVISAGVTLDRPRFAASLRLRYFGPRVLDTQGDASSPPSTLVSTQLTWKLARRNAVTLDIFNVLNSAAADVTYYYASWLPSDAARPALAQNAAINPALGGSGVNDYHLHPSQARTVRLTTTIGL